LLVEYLTSPNLVPQTQTEDSGVFFMGSILQNLSHHQAIETILTSVDGWRDEMIELVQNWSKINSGSRNLEGLGQMELEIVEAFEPLGAEVSFLDLGEGDLVNADGALETVANGRSIKFAKNLEANRRILMTGHTDTVFRT